MVPLPREFVYGVRHVKGRILLEHGELVRLIVRHGLHDRHLIGHTEDELKVRPLVSGDAGRSDADHAVGDKDGRLIAVTKGGELEQLASEFRSDLPELKLLLDMEYRGEIVQRDLAVCYLRHFLDESMEVFLLDRQTGSKGMPAEVLQQVGAPLDQGVYIEAAHTPSRSRDGLAVRVGEYDRGAVVLLAETARHYTDDATVPGGIIDYDHLMLIHVLKSLHDLIRLLRDRLVDLPSLGIVLIQIDAPLEGVLWVLGEK